MMQIVRRYDIYLPLEYNPEPDGTRRRIEGEKFDTVEQKLFEEFGGVTFVQESFPLKGRWRGETRNYTDEIRIFTVLDFRCETSLGENFLREYKETLKNEFQQEEILILYQEMKTL
ncbi:TPA: hypothetical protein EYP66_17675 [Candidatus Poribacteria bacterium]|nr:hypothetical protein [Candidatus Poribacteria bacterium]